MKTISHRPVSLGLIAFCAVFAVLAGMVGTSVSSAGGGSASDPQATNIRVISLPTNDLVFSPTDQKIYASIPGSDPGYGNTLTAIDPFTGVIGTSTLIGSEPTQLAISADGQSIYTHLAGAFAVARFEVATRTAGQRFAIGLDSFSGPMSASDIAVSPDNPNVIAVARQITNISPSQQGVAVYDSGVRLSQTQPGHINGSFDVAFGANGQTLFGSGGYNGLASMSVSASGVTVTSTSTGTGDIKYDSGKLITSAGQVIDANTKALLGTFPATSSKAFVPELSAGRVYVVEPASLQNDSVRLRVFDVNTFTEIANAAFFGVQGSPTSLVRWGSNGLAFRTTAGQLVLMQTDLIPTSNPLPIPPPLPTPTPTPATPAIFVRRIDLPANDLVYNNATNSIIASIPGSAGTGLGNTLTYVDPANGQIGQSVFIGSEPTKIAASDDGVTLYTALNGANAIRTFNAVTATPSTQFSPPGNFGRPDDMSVAPGNPNRIALAGHTANAALFEGGVQRPILATGGAYAINSVSFSSDPNVFYGYDDYSSGYELVKYTNGPSGVTGTLIANNLFYGYNVQMEHHDGLLYATSGRVVDPEARQPDGSFMFGNYADTMAIDPALNRAFFIRNGILWVFDLTTYAKIGSAQLPNFSGKADSLVRWGPNGLAYRTQDYSGGDSNVYILQSHLVTEAAPVPTGIQFTQPGYAPLETDGAAAIHIRRTGDLSGNATIDYSTADGTAVAGVDYASVAGSVNFAPGEAIKTVSVPLFNDNIFEGLKTFSFTMTAQPGTNVEYLGPRTIDVSIQNDDQRPGITSASLAANEPPAAGQNVARVTVALSRPSDESVSVNYQTANYTAMAGLDYAAGGGTLIFAPLETQKSIDIPILADNLYELDESFQVIFSAPANSYLLTSEVTVTIKNYGAKPQFDFDGDGKADVAVFRPESGDWYVYGSQAGFMAASWGVATDKLVPADYDGDGKTDHAVFRDGAWLIYQSSGSAIDVAWGAAGDIPVPADYDGDGKADIAIFREGVWWIYQSTAGPVGVAWGVATDIPVPADYDGDGKADIAIVRDGVWWIYQSTAGPTGVAWGQAGDKPVPADYDGDGKTDVAIVRDGVWWIYQSTLGATGVAWGSATDIPVPADYDGDGKADVAIFREGTWWIYQSASGAVGVPWGVASDIPVPRR